MGNLKKILAKETLPWLKKSAIQIINVFVILFLYGHLYNMLNNKWIHLEFVTTIAGVWAFILLGYWLFWKLLGTDKMIASLIAQLKKKKK